MNTLFEVTCWISTLQFSHMNGNLRANYKYCVTKWHISGTSIESMWQATLHTVTSVDVDEWFWDWQISAR